MIRFLHAADLHLGMRITRFDQTACERIGEARFKAIEQLKAHVEKHQVDFVLIAGDLFDHHSVSHQIAERAFELFNGRSMPPVFILPGNHDPLTPGGVWDRDPWMREEPAKRTVLLRECVPLPIPDVPATIFPCPCRSRNSIDDPTKWIEKHPRTPDEQSIRIGLAHGSLKIMPNLPDDDHLIRKDAAEYLGLDYLALGHWHKPLRIPSADGAERTVYSGTHEPMRFPETSAGASTGWAPVTAGGDESRFDDSGVGTAQIVTIEEAGAPPKIETVEIGRLRWVAERVDATSGRPGDIMANYSQRPTPELTLLRLGIFGVVEPEAHRRLHDRMPDILKNYCLGSSVDMDDLLIKADPEELKRMVGDGVLAKVLERLRMESESTDAPEKRVAEHAMKLLYRISWENQAS